MLKKGREEKGMMKCLWHGATRPKSGNETSVWLVHCGGVCLRRTSCLRRVFAETLRRQWRHHRSCGISSISGRLRSGQQGQERYLALVPQDT